MDAGKHFSSIKKSYINYEDSHNENTTQFFFFLCTAFLVFSYEAMADQPSENNSKIIPSYTQPIPTKKPIKAYSKQLYSVAQLNAPEIISPKNNSTFSHYPRTLKLRWKPVSNPAAYTVEVYCLGSCGSGIWSPCMNSCNLCYASSFGKVFKESEHFKSSVL